MTTQLNPPIPLITPKGKGFAHLIIDYSQEHDLMWVVFLDESGECWTYGNKDVKMVENVTLGRVKVEKPVETPSRIKQCDECRNHVNIDINMIVNNSGKNNGMSHSNVCNQVWGRRGWRQLGEYDG